MPLLPALLAAAALQGGCQPGDGLGYICGPVASEDLARIPSTPWIVASGLNAGAPAHLYLIDHRSKRATALFPGAAPALRPEAVYRDCPGPPRLEAMSMDGLGLLAGAGARHVLLAANHGDRHAIEVFRIDARGEAPAIAWIGCVPLPAGTLANAVVPLADGGLLLASFHDPRDDEAWARMARGESTGAVWEWHADRGLRRVEVGDLAGANGIELSADEATLYVSAWAARRLLVIDRRSGARREIPLDFLPDNIHRAPDGTLLVAGQRATVQSIAACTGPECPQRWTVVRIDPRRATVTPLLARPGTAEIGYACGALQVEDTLYVTARGAARVAWVPLASLPSLR